MFENYEGLILAHYDVGISGNPVLFGSVIAEDAPENQPSSSPIPSSYVSGNASITNDGSFQLQLPGFRVPIVSYQQDLPSNAASGGPAVTTQGSPSASVQ